MRDLLFMFRGSFHLGVEVALHTEELGKILIVVVKKLVDLRVPDDDDLQFERNWFRFQPFGGGITEHLQWILDPDLPPLEGDLQCFPGEADAEQIVRVQDQVAPVGSVERPWLDHREIGGGDPHLYAPLDRAEQVGIGSVLLHDHWCAFRLRVIDQDIDIVALERVGLRDREGEGHLLSTVLPPFLELFQVLDDIHLDGLEEGDHLRKLTVA